MYYVVLISVLLFISCSTQTDYAGEVYHSRHLNSHDLVLVDSLQYVNPSDTSFIGRLGRLYYWNDHILVTDREFLSILVFDNDLNLLHRIGGRGRGPGEYTVTPEIMLDDQYLWVMDYQTKTMNLYNRDFSHILSYELPFELYYFLPPIKVDNFFIFTAAGPASVTEAQYYKNYNSLFQMDTTFTIIANFLDWDDIYFDDDLAAYARGGFVLLTNGLNDTFFAKQQSSFSNYAISSNLDILKSFSSKPKYYREPPRVPVNEVQQSLENFIDFTAQVTRFHNISYDKSYHRFFIHYINFNREGVRQRDLLLSDQYLQVFNENYDCIYDGPIPGTFAFTKDGNVYILAEETPERIKINIYSLVNRE